MEVRRVTLEDYAQIARWWKAQGRSILAWELLPTLGFMVHEGGENIAVAWLYCSDSSVGFVGWTTTNPDSKRRNVAKALRLLDHSVQSAAEKMNMKMLFRFSGGGGFSRHLVKLGWKDTLIKHDLFLREV